MRRFGAFLKKKQVNDPKLLLELVWVVTIYSNLSES